MKLIINFRLIYTRMIVSTSLVKVADSTSSSMESRHVQFAISGDCEEFDKLAERKSAVATQGRRNDKQSDGPAAVISGEREPRGSSFFSAVPSPQHSRPFIFLSSKHKPIHFHRFFFSLVDFYTGMCATSLHFSMLLCLNFDKKINRLRRMRNSIS